MKDNGVPDLFIEKLLLDELPRRTKERLLKDPSVQRRLEELKAENRSILETYPPEAVAEAIRQRSRLSRPAETGAESTAGGGRGGGAVEGRASDRRCLGRPAAPPRRLSRPRLIPAAGFALLVLAGGLLLIARGPGLFAPQAEVRPAEVRLKGGEAHLNVYMRTDTGAQALREGDRVLEGTTLQVGYVAGANRYGVIVSIDGSGTLTLHFPASPLSGSALEGEGEVLLPFAYTLDDAPGFERFFFVVSEKPFSADEVLEAAEDLAEEPENARTQKLRLPAGAAQSSILLLK